MRAASRVAVRHKFARSSPALVAWTHCRPHACAVRSLSAAPGSDTEPAAGCVSSVSVRNSFARQGALTPLAPSKGNTLTWYACGPTVYDDAHLGHARTFVCQVRVLSPCRRGVACPGLAYVVVGQPRCALEVGH